MNTVKENWFKYCVGFAVCLLIRLIPFRPPNIEPILATQMPFSKNYGTFAAFSFAFFSMILYDAITNKLGVWTLITAITYGLLGILSSIYLKNKENTPWNYAKFALLGTLIFDGITGLSIGPLFFHQSMVEAIIGQIPFTAIHLFGNISFAILLSPAIYSAVVQNKKFETKSVISFLNYKLI